MKVRLISAAVGIVLCVALLIIGDYYPMPIKIAISIVSGILCYEFISAKSLFKKYSISIPCLAFSVLMPLLCNTVLEYIPLYVYTIVFFVLLVVLHNTIKVEDALFAYGGTLLITLSMTAFSDVAFGEFGHTSFWVVLTLAVPWLADSGAYFAGVFFGKHKLCPSISPKKTIEGAIGGLVCGTLGAVLVGYIFSLIYAADLSVGGGNVTAEVEYLPLIIIGLINPIVSIFGDLTFSLIKRSCGIKDFGSIMPGHGGMLDRFDSIILCAPLVFLISQYFTVISY